MKRVLLTISLMVWMSLLLGGCRSEKEEAPLAKEEIVSKKELLGKKVVMIIAPEGFRDEELIEPQDVLTGKGAEVKVASVSLETAKGMLNVQVKPDLLISDIKPDQWDAIILVGGTGASRYWNDPSVHLLLIEAVKQNKIVGAICIAPVTCANAGILAGKKATVSESEAQKLKDKGAQYTGQGVQRDGKIITASGPPVAREFGEAIAQALKE
ncbi:MAG: DJ-1/PfpI family protein [Candidatus Zixiibacteriota bacterium]